MWPAAPQGRSSDLPNKLFSITPNGRTLVTTDSAPGTPYMIRVWHRGDDAAPPVEAASFSVPSDDPLIWQLTITHDGQRIAVAARSGLSLWSLQDDRPTQLWHKPGDCHSVAFSPDGRQLAASYVGSGVQQGVRLFNAAGEPQTQWEFPNPPNDLAFAPDGRHLLTANSNGTVYILRLKELAEHSQTSK